MKTDAQDKKKTNWKKWFIGLFALNIAFVLTLVIFIFWPISNVTYPPDQNNEYGQSSEFIVQTTKQNINDLSNAYIDQFLAGTDHNYRLEIDEDIHLIGELPVFSTTLPLSVRFEPIVQDNGDLVLRQQSISLGLLELPNQKIMEYLDRYLPMPPWVTVNPEDEEIYVAVTAMDIRSNFQVEVERINLEQDDLAFKIIVPYRTLGIDAEPIEQ
ncbi:YpmS family protein [Alkalicoccobacillus plakortidis]|uniref:YpmS family protein n=1 Tax=Alkalicoccobacillus plakortidis TaxID=444060 RepID=A0ABT0XPZ8_9BACI|nr:YpmS family protein [Alkalicoccobacillus plakortidis]MCM2677337.1 YpmS family protein [Alkalicoccobacillus plakortidis]